mgnify:CR=1 FL=1
MKNQSIMKIIKGSWILVPFIYGGFYDWIIFAMAVIGLYYLYYDNSTKRIYAFFSLLGLLLFIQFLIFMGMDYRWISYILTLYIFVILNMICR